MKRISILVMVIVVLIIGMIFAADCYFDYNDSGLPTESKSKKIILTSDGCCFPVYNLKLVLINKNTNEEYVLCTSEYVYEMDILEYKIPRFDNGDYWLNLYCEPYYGETYIFDKKILDISDFNDFRKSGLLLFFQESGDVCINVITKDDKDIYDLTTNEDDVWKLADTTTYGLN